ncbi:hypothetical protein [Treponema sp.]|uniref:hypothetical protein n=1 Tax=Treponema sp. TaxID=166 RepID=UPI0025807271|nr:hypothetical protein [Treponema sp.]
MRFYELPPEVENKIRDTDSRPFVRVVFELASGDVYIPDSDILECVATSYKTEAGGIVNSGELLLKGLYDVEHNAEYTTGLGVQIWYCFGERENTFFRFHLFVDNNGFQSQETGFLDKTTKVRLIDLSSKLDDIKLQHNWTDAQTVVHSVVCDRTNPENSLVHIIAKRGGLNANEINCGTLRFDIPYVVVAGSAWKELCALAKAYDAVVECGKDLTLSFIESPYDVENEYSEDSDFTLDETQITHYRFFNNNDKYANNVRLKYTRYVQTERQELWSYSDAPVWYDEDMKPYYPFTDDSRKIISDNDYQAFYTAKNEEEKTRNVVYADQLDSEQDFLDAMEVNGEDKPVIIQYDTSTYKDRAIVQLGRDGKLVGLRKASITGRAIISETNYSIFVKDDSEISVRGQIVKNVTSRFLSDDLFEDEPFCQRRAKDLLQECINCKGAYYLTTFIPLIHARVGAFMDIRLNEKSSFKKVRIDELTFRYKNKEAFSSEIWVTRV